MAPLNGSGGVSPRPVRVLSVPESAPINIRFLGPILGLVTHWHAKRSVPCLGETRCPPAVHRSRQFWKGYAPVDLWELSTDLWVPAVLEVTESLDNVLQGRRLRGEVWMLSRLQGGKTGQVVGLHSETLDEAELREPFSILPVLERFYHVAGLQLGAPNPVPKQLLLAPCEGVAPKLLTELTAPVQEDEETLRKAREAFRKQLGDMRGRLKQGSPGATSGGQEVHPRTNGKGNDQSGTNGKGNDQSGTNGKGGQQ